MKIILNEQNLEQVMVFKSQEIKAQFWLFLMSIQSFIHFNQNITGILCYQKFEAFLVGKMLTWKLQKLEREI